MSAPWQTARELRAIADKLEQTAEQQPRTAQEVIKRFAPKDCELHVRSELDLFYVGQKGFDARRALASRAGEQLGHHIAQKLDYELERGLRHPGGFWAPQDRFAAPFDTKEYYTAVVVVMSKAQLVALIEKAIEAGRSR